MKINSSKIDWKSDENYFFINPKKIFNFDWKVLSPSSLKGHLFFMSSGTQQIKCLALSKKAFLNSARAVNEHLQSTNQDRWLVSLPLFHVGGLSILARSFLSQSSYIFLENKWNPQLFCQKVEKHQITLTSLVPTQLYDLVLKGLSSPLSLRAVLVGGDFLPSSIYREARKLKWPILPTYGSTELCSQIATAPLDSLNQSSYPQLKILSHCEVSQNEKGYLRVQSESLFTRAFYLDFKTGKVQKIISHPDFWESKDKGEIQSLNLKIKGRQESIKIRGEKISLYELQDVIMQTALNAKSQGEFQILATSHPRKGHQIDLVSTERDFNLLLKIRADFNQKMGKNEHIQNCYFVLNFPQTVLLKTQMNKLQNQLGFSKGV